MRSTGGPHDARDAGVPVKNHNGIVELVRIRMEARTPGEGHPPPFSGDGQLVDFLQAKKIIKCRAPKASTGVPYRLCA
jgi:hypothetical protein